MKGSILILEDSPTFADMMALRLSGAFPRFDIHCANSLAQAKALIARHAFNVVLTDLNVGDSDGLNTAVAIRQVTDAPIVIYSGLLREQQTIDQAVHLGFEDLFAKGDASSAELIERIQCLLDAQDPPVAACRTSICRTAKG
ncbi:MAG: response regulator [Burkholderiaceae bacterium]